MAFKGMPPSIRHEAAHLDGNTNNNAEENLVWATPVENAAHKIDHGTVMIGERNAQSRLLERDIHQIFRRFCNGELPDKIAVDFGITTSAVRRIVSGGMWKHVDVGQLRAAARIQSQTNLEASWIAAAARRRDRGATLRAK
jgi:hypothetical protein